MISCRMHTIHIENKKSYIALSYAWGQNPCTRDILIENESFAVRENLFDFLLHQLLRQNRACRSRKRKRFQSFWIDAICSDQTSKLEKNHQVAMIGKIYSNASKVVAWLGTYVDDEGGITESILRTLNEAIQEVKTKRGKTVGLQDPRGFWPLLDRLFQNDYWNRM